MLLTTGRELQFKPRKFVTLMANVRLNYGNTESLNYASNDGTCDHSWLMMLLGNAPQYDYCGHINTLCLFFSKIMLLIIIYSLWNTIMSVGR